MSKKNDFSSYLSGDELVASADKNIIKRAVLLKKQLQEDRKIFKNTNNKKLAHA